MTGRCVEKKVDGYSTRYVYDIDHVIAEYDGNNNLLRKYIYGLGIDKPISMIEAADSNATYYYHFDALDSVTALSDSSGDTVQTYEYSVYGEVAVEDSNHTNPYMFAGRRYDIEIGLYCNRARYYNPFMGRFLQTDPISYADGLNLYTYCGNNPGSLVDPLSLRIDSANVYIYSAEKTQRELGTAVAISAKGGYLWDPGTPLESVVSVTIGDGSQISVISIFSCPTDKTNSSYHLSSATMLPGMQTLTIMARQVRCVRA